MVQPGYRAAGWLGVVTAGLLWVPLLEVSKSSIDQLVQQIQVCASTL